MILAEGLRRQGHELEAIHVVSPWQPRRLWRVAKQRGWGWLLDRATSRVGSPASGEELQALADEYGVVSNRLRDWGRRNEIPVIGTRGLNARTTVGALAAGSQDAVIYSGGGILRADFLEAAGRVLNAHAGPMPQVRGMNAAEWALLLDQPPEVTIHLIDRGIDTGPILLRERYERTGMATAEQLRERAVVTGVRALLSVTGSGRWKEAGEILAEPTTRQCFVMAPALRELVERRLAR